MARRSRSQQNAQRRMRILFGILALLVVGSMVLSAVMSAPVVTTPPPPTPTIRLVLPQVTP
jgi:hypothetical protein